MTSPLTTAARALVLAQSGVECYEDLEPEAQESAREHVRAVLGALWQSIETLPDDADRVIIVSDGKRVAAAGGNLREPGDPFEDLTAWDYDGNGDLDWTPTHWQPLPEPPTPSRNPPA